MLPFQILHADGQRSPSLDLRYVNDIQLPTKPLQCFVFLQKFACNLGNKIAVNKQKYMVERPTSQLCNGIGIKH